MRDRALPFAAAYAEIVIVPVAQREASQADTNRPAAPRIRLPACQQNQQLYEPPGSGTAFRTPMWEFVRSCKAHPTLSGLSATNALQQINKIRLRDGDLGFPWEEGFPDSDDPRMEFVATWDKVRVPFGADILDMAVATAKQKSLKPRNCISESYRFYVSIAGRLQELRPGDYINLPVERMAKAIGVAPRMVSNYAQVAKKSGLITLIAKHHKPSAQAAKYVFHCERFNMDTGEELPPAKDLHFHKDYEEYEDNEEPKDNHEQRKTSRTSEGAERPSGRTGLGIDFQGKAGKPRAVGPSKIGPNPPSQRREELKRQSEFLTKKMG